MPGPAYSIGLRDHDGTTLGDLEGAQLQSVDWSVSGIGNIDFLMKQTNPRIADPQLRRHEVWLEIEGWPRPLEVPWAGPLLTAQGTPGQVEFGGQSIEYYLTKRFIDFNSLYYDGATLNPDGTVTDPPTGFPGYEQVDIAWGLVQYAQGIPLMGITLANGNKSFRVTGGTLTPSGITRLRQYLRVDHKNIMDCLSEFPTLVDYVSGDPNGLDFQILQWRDGHRTFETFYPLRGSLQRNLHLEYGRNLSDYQIKEDATNFCDRVICTGGSDGQVKVENEYHDDVTIAIYGEDLAITTDDNEMDPTELGAVARSFVQARNHVIMDPTLNAARAPVELLGVLQPGDTVPVTIVDGRYNIRAAIYRIKTIKWQVVPNYLQLTFFPMLAG